jgi:hypothetical protein
MSKSKTKLGEKMVSVRIRAESKAIAKALLKTANDKDFGLSIKFDELCALAFDLVTEAHLKLLQERSMTNEDRRERLRQRYIKLRGPVTHDEFTGLMMKPEFFEFLKEHGQGLVAA